MSARPLHYLSGLNGLRAIAVTGVVWHHSHPGFTAFPMTQSGFLGVDVFFVLSGFLITHLLLREHEATGRIALGRFYARRTLRIFPLYYAVVAILALYFAIASRTTNGDAFFEALPYVATYTSNWWQPTGMMGITWSLSAEEQFYLLWPPLLALLGRRSIHVLLGFLALNQAVNFGLVEVPSNNMTQATFTPILMGVLLAFALHDQRRTTERLVTGPTVAAAAAVMLTVANWGGDISGLPRLAFHVATTILIAWLVLRPKSFLTRMLEWRPLGYIGVVSYGIYLLHMIGILVAGRLLARFGIEAAEALFVLAMGGTVCAAAVSYRYFESPLLKLRDGLRGEASTTRTAV